MATAAGHRSPSTSAGRSLPLRRGWMLFVLLIGLAAGACSKSRPNVIVVTFDTTRADRIGYLAGKPGLTPTLDALAARGLAFEQCITAAPITLPSHTTIFTGQYPFTHGVRNNGTYVVPPEAVTLAERFRDAGYDTHAIVSSYVLDSRFGLDQGFATYDDDLSSGSRKELFMFREIPAARVAEKAITWLRGREEKPFFLFLHFFDPHASYAPPAELTGMFPGDAYQAEIAYADRELGRVMAVLEEKKLDDETIIVFTSDHGEGLGAHGEATHGMLLYETTLRVPLIITGPEVPKGRRFPGLVRTADIAPTIATLAGLSAVKADGASLVASWEGREEDSRQAYSEAFAPRLNFGWSEMRSLRSESTTVVQAPIAEVYDRRSDRAEANNLASGNVSSAARQLFASLRKITDGDPFARGGHREAAIDSETRRRLSALGYVWDSSAPASTTRPDPKERIASWTLFEQAQDLIRAGRYEAAAAGLRTLLERDPENVIALSSFATALARTNHPDEALDVLRRILRIDPSREHAYTAAAKLLIEQREYDEAGALAEALSKMRPHVADGYVSRGEVALAQDRLAEAERWFRRALAVEPDSSLAVSALGNALHRAGRLDEAANVLIAGRLKHPDSQAIVYNLAVVTERRGDREKAFEYYRESLQIDPEHSMTWNNLGALLDRSGRRTEAMRCVTRARELDPQNVEATYNLAALQLAAGNPAGAIPLLMEVLQKRPTFVAAAVQLATAHAGLQRYDEAVSIWQQLAPRLPEAWLHIAKLELQRGDNARAREALSRGVAAGGERIREAAKMDAALQKIAG